MEKKGSLINGFLEEEIDNKGSSNELENDVEQPESDDIEQNNTNSEDEEMETDEKQKIPTGATKKLKKRKKGIIYVSNIPKHMNVTRLREILGQYGKIGRVYLQPEKPTEATKHKKKKHLGLNFTEGWVEFDSKRVAKQVVPLLNNTQISTRKRSQFYDCLWSMKYLPRFKWVHLTERLNYEQAVYKQRLMTEVSQARKEATFFQNNLDKSEMIKKKTKKGNKNSMSVK